MRMTKTELKKLEKQFFWLDFFSDEAYQQYLLSEAHIDCCDYDFFPNEDKIIDSIVEDYFEEKNGTVRNMMVFHLASSKNGYKALQRIDALTDFQLDINVRTPKASLTPLMVASCNGNKQAVEALVEMGADVEAVDFNGNNIAVHGIFSYKVNFIKWLYKKFPQTFDFNNPELELTGIVCAENQFELLKFFLSKGAPIDLENQRLGSNLDYCMLYSCFDIATYLIENGATTINFNSKSFVAQDLFVPLTNRLQELKQINSGDTVQIENLIKENRIRFFLKRL